MLRTILMTPRVTGFIVLAVCLLVIVLMMRGAWQASTRSSHGRRGVNAHTNANGRAKRSYSSSRAAAAAAFDYEHDFGRRMNPYECEQGGHWHIGHAK